MVDRVPTIDEIDSAEKLEAYLKTRPPWEAQLLALRTALRVMPCIGNILSDDQIPSTLKKNCVLCVYRAILISWVAFSNTSDDWAGPLSAAESFADRYGNAIENKKGVSGYVAYIAGDAALSLRSPLDARRAAAKATQSAHDIFEGLGSKVTTIPSNANTLSASRGFNAALNQLHMDLDDFATRSDSSALLPIWFLEIAGSSLSYEEASFSSSISDLGHPWTLVFLFYDSFKIGPRKFTDIPSAGQAVYVDIAKEDDAFWSRDADLVMKDIAERLRGEQSEQKTTTLPMPPEPEAGPGPQYDLVNGKLTLVSSRPIANDLNNGQVRLFERLRRDIERLVSIAQKIDNSHPNLAFSIREYAELLDTPLEELDVTAVWAVGGSLAGFAQSFREQNRNRTLAEPLEPEVDGLLQSVIRQHGAFIMGFEEGRDLVDRADRFALDPDKLRGLAESGNPLIEELASNADLVDDYARAVHKSISDVLHDIGWMTARNGYSGFLIIQNAVRAIIKTTISNELVRNAVSDKLGDPFLIAASTFLSSFSSSLLAFFVNFPEMHAYIQYTLNIIEHDRQLTL